MSTYMEKKGNVVRKWYVVDAAGKPLGKTAVIVPTSGTAHNKPDAGDGVVALDLQTGKRAWFTHFGQDANGVAANDKHVFATSDDEHVYALAILALIHI